MKNNPIKNKKAVSYNLRTYQRKGVNLILKKFNCRALLADDMGLGKTLQAIEVMKRAKRFPVVVCCPAYLKYNWLQEINKFSPDLKVFVCSGRTAKVPKTKFDVFLANYEILKYWVEEFLRMKIGFAFFDESHYLKNKKAKRTKAALKLSQRTSSILLMTGTPIENRPVEIFYQIALLDNTIFPNWLKFAKRYNSCHRTMYGWEMGKAKNTAELNQILYDRCMIRRKKEDVLTELPPILRQVIPLDIDNRKEYEEAKKDILEWLRKNTELNVAKAAKVEAQIKLDKLKLIAAQGKVEQVSEWINEESQNQKLVVFCYHKKILEALDKKLKNHLLCSSDIPLDERQKLVQKFQNDPDARVFLTTLRVGGTGITLTASHTTVTLQFGWNPSLHDQAEARVHRIGQKSDSVNAIYFVGKDTVEENIMSLIDGKRKDIDSIMDAQDPGSDKLLTDLLKIFKQA